jgi:hypothetical protein
MRDELQLGINSSTPRVPQPANQGLAARQDGYSNRATRKCRGSRNSSTSFTSFTSFASSTSSFLIETVRRLETTVTHSYKRRKHFLIDTRTGFPVMRPEGFPEHGSRSTVRDSRATETNAAQSFPRQLRQSLSSPFSLFTFPFSNPSTVISLGACRPVVLISQSAPAFGAFPSEFHAFGNDSPRWQSRRKDFREGFSI